MGLKELLADSKYNFVYGTHRLTRGRYFYLPDGNFLSVKKPIAGASAEYEPGSAVEGRTTLTRVGLGAIIAGPAGAIVGGMFKKDRAKGYVSITFADGEVAVIEGALKDEPKLRKITQQINAAAKYFRE